MAFLKGGNYCSSSSTIVLGNSVETQCTYVCTWWVGRNRTTNAVREKNRVRVLNAQHEKMETTLSLNVRSIWIKGYYQTVFIFWTKSSIVQVVTSNKGYAWPMPISGDLNILDVNLRPLRGIYDLQQLLARQRNPI